MNAGVCKDSVGNCPFTAKIPAAVKPQRKPLYKKDEILEALGADVKPLPPIGKPIPSSPAPRESKPGRLLK